jgi:hypothetical protein
MRGAAFAFWLLLCSGAAGWTLILMAQEGMWGQRSGSQLVAPVLFSAFTLLPFIVLLIAIWRALGEAKQFLLVSAAAAVTVGLGVYMVYDALFVSQGDQRGLIFIFVPPVQLIGAIFALGVAGRAKTLRRTS